MTHTVSPHSGAVATVGMFDGVHRGHRCVIDRVTQLARQRGAEAVAVTFADHPLTVVAPDRAPLLLMDAADKEAALRAAGIDRVVMLDFTDAMRSMTASEFLAMLRRCHGVDALVMGFNNRLGSDGMTAPQLALERPAGIGIIEAGVCDGGAGVSSSAIRAALTAGRPDEARAMLGHPYRLSGNVVGGKRLGRTIGFPTANIDVSPRRLVPAAGVYAADVSVDGLDGVPMRAMMNIGRRPTVDTPDAPLTVEVHLIDRHIDLYDRRISVDFVSRLRDERRFGSLDELRTALLHDSRAALQA